MWNDVDVLIFDQYYSDYCSIWWLSLSFMDLSWLFVHVFGADEYDCINECSDRHWNDSQSLFHCRSISFSQMCVIHFISPDYSCADIQSWENIYSIFSNRSIRPFLLYSTTSYISRLVLYESYHHLFLSDFILCYSFYLHSIYSRENSTTKSEMSSKNSSTSRSYFTIINHSIFSMSICHSSLFAEHVPDVFW